MIVVIVVMMSVVNRIFCIRFPISGENNNVLNDIHAHLGKIKLNIDIKSEFFSKRKNKKYDAFNAMKLVLERLLYFM